MSESLVSIRQTGECESSSHDLFKFPLKPIQRWRFMFPPPTSTHHPHWRRWPWGEMMWVRLGKAKVAARHPPKQAWEHSHEKYAKKVFFGNQTFEKKEKHSTHTRRWGTITKPSFPFQFAKNHAFPIEGRLGDEGFLSKCCNIKSGLFFFFFPSSVTQLSTDPWHMLDLHTHTDTTVILTLTCSETSHPLLRMIMLRNHPVLHRRASVRDTSSQSDQNTWGELAVPLLTYVSPAWTKEPSHTLEWTSCGVFTGGLSFHTEIGKIIHNFTCQQAWFHFKINDFSVAVWKQTLALTKQVLIITENSDYTNSIGSAPLPPSGSICIYL